MHAEDSSPRPPPGDPADPGPPAARSSAGRGRALAALGAVLAVALAARVAPFQRFFTPQGVLLAADGDAYYHALRAERLAGDWPHVPWVDPGMNHPLGAEIPWPPLLDQLVATVAVATGSATPDHVAAVAALLPPVLGVAVVALVAALAGALLGGAPWWEAALLVALLPASLRQSFVGRADHHALELLLSTAAFVAFLSASRRDAGWRSPAALGVALALSFWNWTGSALYLLVLAAAVAGSHLAAPPGDPVPGRFARALAAGATVAAVLLASSVAALGPPGALTSARLTPISGLAVALCAATAAGAALIAAARRRDPGAGVARRLLHLGGVVLLGGAAALAVPERLRAGVEQGLTAAAAASAWYETIPEFWPLVLGGHQPWSTDLVLALLGFGLTWLALPLAVPAFRRAWRDAPARRGPLTFLAVWVIAAATLALLRRRFEGYAALALAVVTAWVVREAVAALGPWLRARRWPAAAVTAAALLGVAAPALPVTLTGGVAELPGGAADKVPLLRWLRGVPARPGREGVLSHWAEGHEIQWLARKPVLATPFGTDIDARSMEDQARFFTALEPGAAEALLRARRVGFLLLGNPVREVATLAPFAPGTPRWAFEERDREAGTRYAMHPEFFSLVVSRLWFLDGGSPRGDAPGLAVYRLLGESATSQEVLGIRAQSYKLFGVVEGAVLEVRGAPPGGPVTASCRVVTNARRAFTWSTRALAGPDGVARLRVPYAAGANGATVAGPYQVTDGRRAARVSPPEAAVAEGGIVPVTWEG